jgi:hypothetical protein
MPAVIKFPKLEKFTKNFKGLGTQEVRIGFLGEEKNKREEGNITNVELAALHTFGSPSQKIPARNIFVGFQDPQKVDEMKNILSSTLKAELQKNNLNKQAENIGLKKAGLVGENIIEDAFQTGGFGTWQPLSPRTIKIKKKNKEWTLVEEGELKDSRISKVVKISNN